MYTYGNSGSTLIDAGRSNTYGTDVAPNVHHVTIKGLPITGDLKDAIKLHSGPQAVIFNNSAGQNVTRYNTIVGDEPHYCNDPLGGGENATGAEGYPGPTPTFTTIEYPMIWMMPLKQKVEMEMFVSEIGS